MNINPLAKMKKISKTLKTKDKQKHTTLTEEETPKSHPTLETRIITSKQPEDHRKFRLIVEDEEEDINHNETNINNDIKGDIHNHKEDMNFEDQYNASKLNEAQFFHNGLRTLHERVSAVRRVICFPDSILLKVQTVELQNCLIGQLARILCLYKINEIIIIHDHSYNRKIMGADPADFMVKVLQYLETPQYLRKKLFPISPELKFVGLVAPLECHHHLKQDELFPYREGVVIKRPVKENSGSWVDVGLLKVN